MTNKRWRLLILLAVYALLLVGSWYLRRYLPEINNINTHPEDAAMMRMVIITLSALFVATFALPFVPGAEIGFALMLVFGTEYAPLVYACMVSALALAYCVGRFVPPNLIAALFGFFGLTKAQKMMVEFAPLDADQRLTLLTENAPNKLIPLLLKHRYLALIALLNIPGNSVIGGAGGIALSAGMSGLFRFPLYLLTILIAVAPGPVIFIIAEKLVS